MFNHTHALTDPGSIPNLERLYVKVASSYTKAVNRYAGRKRPLFAPFDWAVKRGGKAIRTCIIYIANNSVEKKLFRQAEEDRWTFLAYLEKKNPFSEPLRLRTASRRLRRAVSFVKARVATDTPLDYPFLNLLFKGLSATETEQLTDFIISSCAGDSFAAASAFFEGRHAMLGAVHASIGKEYDLAEIYERESDLAYREMLEVVGQSFDDLAGRAFLRGSLAESLLPALLQQTHARLSQVFRFLHLSGRGT
jgi:hypothetical protein